MIEPIYPIILTSQRPTFCCGCGCTAAGGEMITAGEPFTVVKADGVEDTYLRAAGEPVCQRCKIGSGTPNLNYLQYLEIRQMAQAV